MSIDLSSDAPAPSTRSPITRDQQREATRKAVLACALEVFSETGFEGATTREIASRAGVNHAMIQYYFENKEQLWRAAVQFLFKRMGDEISFSEDRIAAEFNGDTRAWAEACVREYVSYCARHPDHARLMIQASIRGGDRLAWLAKRYIRRSRVNGEAFFRRAIADGVFPDTNVAALMYSVVGASQIFFALAPEVKAVWGIDPRSEDMVEAHARTLVALLFREP
jgi:AcrR family transcriptional regulator